MTLFTLGFLLASLHHQRWWKRVLVVLLATPVAVVANAMRVTLTAVLTRYSEAWGHGTLHELTGWLVFILSFLLLVGISWLLKGTLLGQRPGGEAGGR